MAVSVSINGVTFSIPETGDENWGDDVTGWIQAASSDLLQKTGGSFTLGADANFGPTFGLVSPYFKSTSANISATGILRLANTDGIGWRNIGDSADQLLAPAADGILSYDSVDLVNLSATQTLTNKTLNSITLGSPTITTPDIDGGTIDNTVIGGTTPAAGSFSTADIDGGTIDGATIGGVTPAAITATSVTTSTVDVASAGNMAIGATVGANNLDLGAASSTVVVKGDLNVEGTTTTVDSATLEVADANITVNDGGSDATAEGAGLTAERVTDDGLLQYEDALASHWKIGKVGDVSEVATVSQTQTLTNKTISGNTAGNLSPDGVETLTLPVATDTLVGRDTTDTLTNKTLTTPVLTTPDVDGATTYDEVATPATPAAGEHKLYYKSDGLLYTLNDAGEEVPVGSGAGGSGSGETNYILNPSASVNTEGWVDSGTGLTLSRTTTSAELPREFITDTAIKLANEGTGSSFVYYRFTMGAADKNRKQQIKWAQVVGSTYADGDYSVELHTNTNDTYTGSDATLTLSEDVGGVSSIPASDGSYLNTFDSDGSDYYELRIIRVAGSSGANDFITLADVVVGPGSPAVGFAGGEAIAITTAVSNLTTNIDNEGGFFWRRGDRMVCDATLEMSGASTDAAVAWAIPNGLTADLTKTYQGHTGNTDKVPIGLWYFIDSSTGNQWHGTMNIDISTGVIRLNEGVGGTSIVSPVANFPVTFAANDTINVRFSVPITEWAGGTVNLINDSVAAQNARSQNDTPVTGVGNPIRVDFVNQNNKGIDWDSGNKEFIAPADGDYDFSFILSASTVNSRLYAQIVKNGSLEQQFYATDGIGGGSTDLVSGSGRVMDVSAGDTIGLELGDLGGGGNVTAISAAARWVFSLSRTPDFTAGQAVGFGNASDDNYGLVQYDEFLDTTTLPTGSTSPTNPSVKVVKVGSQVTITASVTIGTSPGNQLTWAAIIPSNMRPALDQTTTQNFDTTANQVQFIEVTSGGQIQMFNRAFTTSILNANFTASAVVQGSISYTVD